MITEIDINRDSTACTIPAEMETAGFHAITLKQLENMDLLNRRDTKFLISTEQYYQLLPLLQERCFILAVNGFRTVTYSTQYYDSFDFTMFIQHQNGKGNRYKVRK